MVHYQTVCILIINCLICQQPKKKCRPISYISLAKKEIERDIFRTEKTDEKMNNIAKSTRTRCFSKDSNILNQLKCTTNINWNM